MTVLLGSEALRSGQLTRHELRTAYRRLHPDVYAPKHAALTLDDRIAAAWLWSRRRGIVCGLAASALHGAKWVDTDVLIELARLDALAAATHYKNEDVRELARRHPRAREIRRLDGVLHLVDAGAESPQESRVRLLLMDNGFPRPSTQIPVPGPDGLPRYYLDMGWEDILVAVEYDGERRARASRLR